MNELRDPAPILAPEIAEYSSNQGLTLQTKSTVGVHTTFYVKDVGDKYFVTINQKQESGTTAGAALVEVKKQTGILASSGDNIGAVDLFDVKGIFGTCSDEHLAAIRYISNRPLRHTTKSLFFAISFADLTKPNLDSIACDLEKIVIQLQSQ